MRIKLLFAMLVVLGAAGRAHAYPQWQFARGDVSCTGCHLAPDGGGLLNENGLNTAQAIAWKDHDPGFIYGKVPTPEWLTLGGDLRGAAGLVNNGHEMDAAGYPMQAEVAASVHAKGFSVHATGGFRSPSDGASALHVLWSRQHYVMWQQNEGGNEGLYVRVGRFAPTFGLRLAEHVVYTQRYGGNPLYFEAYAAGVSYVHGKAEVHATAFVHDPIATAPEHGDGGALYGEVRLGQHAAVGVEGKYSKSDDQAKTYGGLTGKLYVPSVDINFAGEAQYIQQKAETVSYKRNQLVTYVQGSKPLPKNLMLDVGWGHFTEETSVKGAWRDAVDVNLHWFYDSHVELLLTTRLELLNTGSGPNGGWALGQLHIRL